MPKFLNSELAELAHQLTISPKRLRLEQIGGIEKLLGLVESDRSYPYDFVCFHITGYQKRGASAGSVISGKAIIADLVTMAEVISRKANIPASAVRDTSRTHEELAGELMAFSLSLNQK